MDLTKPYEKGYFPESILKGLKFYYELLDKVNIRIYLNESFSLKRKDIQLAIDFLSSIPDDADINNIYISHPQLTLGMESLESFSTLTLEELYDNETRIIFCLDHFLFTATNIMLIKAKIGISKTIHSLSIDDKIKYLIENKYYYTQNQDSFPARFKKETVEYCDSLIKKYKELREAEESNPINEEVKKMIESYFLLINSSIKSNDLISPLLDKKFEEFASKLKAMLFIPSFYDIKASDKERTFHIFLLGVLQGRVEGYKVSSNKESGIGRYDIALFPLENKNPGVIIEIKKIETTSNIEEELDNALKQIQSRHYHTELNNSGVNIILNIAIVFEGLEPHIKFRVG